MASYEKMKKDDLVKVARAQDQELKRLKKEVKHSVETAEGLPLLAVSVVQTGDRSFELVRIRYDINQNKAAIDEVLPFSTQYRVSFEAKKALVEEIINQRCEREVRED